MLHDLQQTMLAEPVKRLKIVTAEFADDLGSILRSRKPIVLRLGPVLDIFELKIRRAGVQKRFVRVR
jgi:hypothetical protein